MLSRPLRSALFIDFENTGSSAISANLGNLLDWLSDGVFEKTPRKRRLLTKRVYWNSQAERYRDAFVRQHVDVILCERFANLKNSADIKMAIDIVEFAIRNPRLNEVILLTTDSDFVPVIQWLANRGVKTSIVVSEDHPTSYTAYSYHADQLIPRRILNDALNYVRPKRRGLFRRKPAVQSTMVPAPAPALPTPAPKALPPSKTPVKVSKIAPAALTPADLNPIVAEVVRITSARPNQKTAQRNIEQALSRISQFSKTGPDRYFGFDTYKALMLELGKHEPKLKITDEAKSGFSVRYAPDD